MLALFRKVGQEFRVNTTTRYSQSDPSISPLASGGWIAAWSDTGVSPDASWSDVKLQIFTASGAKSGGEFSVNGPSGNDWQPSVAGLAGGGFAVAWTGAGGIRARVFNAAGRPVGDEFQVNTPTGAEQSGAAVIALASGGFVISWTDYTPGTTDVRAQIFNSAGAEVGGEILVNTTLAGSQSHSAGALLASGRFVLAWSSTTPGVNGADIKGQVFDAAGARIGGEFLVNTLIADHQGSADVAALANGGFAVTWQSDEDGRYRARAQVFTGAGVKVGGELLVSHPDAGISQLNVTGLGSAGFLIGWENVVDGISSYSTNLGQLYDLQGNRLGGIIALGQERLITGARLDLATLKSGKIAGVFEDGGDLKGQMFQPPVLGTAGADSLTGNSDADLVLAYAGNDILNGGGGADEMHGGAGNDLYHVDNALDIIVEAAGAGSDRLIASAAYTLRPGVSVETLSTPGTGAVTGFTLAGNELVNALIGDAGANRLDGGGGADTMTGGAGDDIYVVDTFSSAAGAAVDRIVEVAGGGIDSVESAVDYLLGAELENLLLTGTTAIRGTGNALANRLTGNAAANLLSGGAGADTILGGAGDDTLNGNSGNDRLDGGPGADRMTGGTEHDVYVVDHAGDQVIENNGAGTDRVESAIAYTLPANVEKLLLTGALAIQGRGNGAANAITGNGAGNLLNGGAGSDTLDGGAGKDLLYGATGADSLKGGSGQDRFLFDTALGAGEVDKILDFSVVDDSVYLNRVIFAAAGANGALAAAAFHKGAAAADAGDRIVYDQATGRIFYDADGSGAAAAMLFATVTAGTPLTSADFVIYG